MNTSKRIGVAVISIIFLVALVSAVPVDAKKEFSVYRWQSKIYWTGSPVNPVEWTGVITTHDNKVGTIYWDNHYSIDVGGVNRFWGEWWIDFDLSDSIVDIRGTHKGIFVYDIGQSVINGHITDTSNDWSNIDGRQTHTIGTLGFDAGGMFILYYLQIN